MEDLRSLAESAGALLRERGETVAVVESSAGGLVSAALLAAPGASAYFVGGAVVYTRTAQQGLLRVPDEAMEGLRASTEEYALLNARTARELLGTTWGLAETGASGPTGNRYGDSPGHSCVAVSGPVEASITLETGSADREGNMWTFARTALDLLERCARERLGNTQSPPPRHSREEPAPEQSGAGIQGRGPGMGSPYRVRGRLRLHGNDGF